MITGILERAYTEKGTFGELTLDGLKLYTVERPWEYNRSGVSCIPEGVYNVTRYKSRKFGDCWILDGIGVTKFKDEGTRWGILIHAANYPSQLEGCIAPGMSLMDSTWGVSSSRMAMEALEDNLDNVHQWTLDIRTKMVSYP